MLRFLGPLTMVALFGINLFGEGVPAVSADEVPPETLDALGLSGMTVIIVDPRLNWPPLPPGPLYDPYDARPDLPGIQSYTLPTLNFVNRRLTNFP